jgi:Ca-activated chloride channel family protein
MKFTYEKWDIARESMDRRVRQLTDLYHRLLNRLAGDAEEALRWVDHLADRHDLWGEGLDFETFKKLLEKAGEIQMDGQRPALTPQGERTMQRLAFEDIFGSLQKAAGPGEHRSRATGDGGEPEPTVRPFTFGDEIHHIDANQTIRNAVRSSLGAGEDQIQIGADDVAVHETEQNTGCATALLVDCSHSMVLYGEDRMTPARTVAMALVELVKRQFPRDRLHVIAFGDDAWEVPLKQVPYLTWGEWHTNTQAALEMARRTLIRGRCPNRQIFMITDGKPTVLDERGRRMIDSGFYNRKIWNRTIDEGAICRRKNIPITTFMVTQDPHLAKFVDQLTEANQGRAYFTGLGKLGQHLMVDYMNNRKRSVR